MLPADQYFADSVIIRIVDANLRMRHRRTAGRAAVRTGRVYRNRTGRLRHAVGLKEMESEIEQRLRHVRREARSPHAKEPKLCSETAVYLAEQNSSGADFQ